MSISKGTAIIETIDSLASAKMFFNMDEDLPILIVEGKDDIEVVERYYYYKDCGQPFKVVSGETLNEKTGGKRSAIASMEKYKSVFTKIFCLVDRDYDFHLGINEKNTNIFYYDYFELENYLFEDNLLRLYLDCFFSCRNHKGFSELIKKFKDVINVFYPFSKIRYLRELNFHKRLEQEFPKDKIEQISNLANKKPTSIFLNQSPKFKDMSLKERVNKYFDIELERIEPKINEFLSSSNEEAAALKEDSDDPLDFFKYNISGKFILNSLHLALNEFLNEPYILKDNSRDLEKRLKEEWIPTHSIKLGELLEEIEKLI